MKTFTSIAATALLAGSSLATMIPNVQYVNLDMHNADKSESFHFQIWADGKRYIVENPMPVATIDAPDYTAWQFCEFETAGPKNVSWHIEDFGTIKASQQLTIEPPQPIISVTCQGVCVPHYSPCYDQNNMLKGPCCNGICLDGLCRTWAYPLGD